MFQGLLKDIIFVPGADVVRRTCPPRAPRNAYMDNHIPTVPGNVLSTFVFDSTFTFRIAYIHDKCFSNERYMLLLMNRAEKITHCVKELWNLLLTRLATSDIVNRYRKVSLMSMDERSKLLFKVDSGFKSHWNEQ